MLVRPTHLSLNHRDLFSRQALYPGVSFDVPLLADTVAEIVSSGTNAQSKGRVLLNPGHGWISDPAAPENTYAILGGTKMNKLGCAQDLLIVDAAETVPCPAHLTGEQAAALPLVGLTGWRALVTKSGATKKVRMFPWQAFLPFVPLRLALEAAVCCLAGSGHCTLSLS